MDTAERFGIDLEAARRRAQRDAAQMLRERLRPPEPDEWPDGGPGSAG